MTFSAESRILMNGGVNSGIILIRLIGDIGTAGGK
jgi:hypothetical protein